jgi:RNA polymerase sigma-70 factor (ECF subfamily)
MGRLRAREKNAPLADADENGEIFMNMVETAPNPEQIASRAELGHLLEEAVLGLPEAYRVVEMLRDVEELSTAETAEALDLSEENVKIRLFRGHAMMRDMLFQRVGTEAKAAFPFMGERCDRVVRGVFLRLGSLESGK